MKIEIGLSGYPSTGYGWEPDREPSEVSYFDSDAPSEDTLPEDIIIGGEIMERFVFEDVPDGTDITFKYLRPFDPPEVEPIKTITVHVDDPANVNTNERPAEYESWVDRLDAEEISSDSDLTYTRRDRFVDWMKYLVWRLKNG
jgi:hypothetical protein